MRGAGHTATDLFFIPYSMFGSILTIGAMVGAIISGKVSDYIGRKWAMRVSACFCIVGWLAIFFAQSSLHLNIGRLFSGFRIGCISYVLMIITGSSFTCWDQLYLGGYWH